MDSTCNANLGLLPCPQPQPSPPSPPNECPTDGPNNRNMCKNLALKFRTDKIGRNKKTAKRKDGRIEGPRMGNTCIAYLAATSRTHTCPGRRVLVEWLSREQWFRRRRRRPSGFPRALCCAPLSAVRGRSTRALQKEKIFRFI